jgi:hypothetical protein
MRANGITAIPMLTFGSDSHHRQGTLFSDRITTRRILSSIPADIGTARNCRKQYCQITVYR